MIVMAKGGAVTVTQSYNDVLAIIGGRKQHELVEFDRRSNAGGNEPFSIRIDQIAAVEYR